MILGASYADKLRVSINPEDSLYLVFLNGTYTKKYEMRISSILNTAPAFRFSNLPSVSTQTILVSLPTYAHIGGMGKK